MRAEKVVDLKKIGSIRTIDIEIDNEKHIFYGNGIATSNSHSYSYTVNSYWSGFAKKYFPYEFFTAYLKCAHMKIKPQKEIYELVNDAKAFDIFVQPPSIQRLNPRFELIDKNIYFGLSDIKHVGDTVVKKLHELNGTKIDLTKCDWYNFLVFASDDIDSRALESLINSGACDCFKIPRIRMVFEYQIYRKLTKKEKAYIAKQLSLFKVDTIKDILNIIVSAPVGRQGACNSADRLEKVLALIELVNNPPHTLVDKPHQIAQLENMLLGVCLTATFLDESKTKYKANCSCQDFNNGYNNQSSYISLACQVDAVKVHVTKRGMHAGEEMCFLTVSDDSGVADSLVVFSETYAEYKELLSEGNRVLISGQRSKDKTSLVVQNIEQIY